jgi:hypothetical protein
MAHDDRDGRPDDQPGPDAGHASPAAPAAPAANAAHPTAAARLGPTGWFLAVAVGSTLLFVLAYLIFVGTTPGQRIENLALLGAELRSDADRAAALDRLSSVTVAIFALALVAVLATGFLRRREVLAVTAAGSMVIAVLLAEVLKDVLPRPVLVDGPAWLLRNSFPSGSAAVAASIAIGALLVVPDRLRWAVLVAGVIFAALIGESVQTTGWHRLSDTIGGVLLVIAVSAGGLVLLARAGRVAPSEGARIDPRLRAALLAVAVGAAVLGAALTILPVIFPLLGAPTGARRSIMQTAFPLVGVGVTVLTIVVFARVIEPYSLGRGERTGSPTESG